MSAPSSRSFSTFIYDNAIAVDNNNIYFSYTGNNYCMFLLVINISGTPYVSKARELEGANLSRVTAITPHSTSSNWLGMSGYFYDSSVASDPRVYSFLVAFYLGNDG